MCLRFPTENSGNGAKKQKSGDLAKQYNDPTSPYYQPPVVYKTPHIPTLADELAKASEGPDPTVIPSKASSLELSTRRRKLREQFRLGLPGQLKYRTREGTERVGASTPRNINLSGSGKGRTI